MPETEQIPEGVALRLLEFIAHNESKALVAGRMGEKTDRAWILATYRECLAAVQGRGDADQG